MKPLEELRAATRKLGEKPWEFWDSESQMYIVEKTDLSTKALLDIFRRKKLEGDVAFTYLTNMKQVTNFDSFDEVDFVTNLDSLMSIYKMVISNGPRADFVIEFSGIVRGTKKSLVEYHTALDRLEERGQEMSEEEKRQSDEKTINHIGIFYILEYTLYVLSLLPQLDDKGRTAIFYQGIKTKEANLPPFTSIADNFKYELCMKIYDKKLRNGLLEIFYIFEEIFNKGKMNAIVPAFKEFNLELLGIFREQGVKDFKTVFLSPWGKKISMDELIEKVRQMNI